MIALADTQWYDTVKWIEDYSALVESSPRGRTRLFNRLKKLSQQIDWKDPVAFIYELYSQWLSYENIRLELIKHWCEYKDATAVHKLCTVTFWWPERDNETCTWNGDTKEAKRVNAERHQQDIEQLNAQVKAAVDMLVWPQAIFDQSHYDRLWDRISRLEYLYELATWWIKFEKLLQLATEVWVGTNGIVTHINTSIWDIVSNHNIIGRSGKSIQATKSDIQRMKHWTN